MLTEYVQSLARVCGSGKRLYVLGLSVLPVLVPACGTQDDIPVHSDREVALLSGLDVPDGLDILTIAKERASEERGVSLSELSVQSVSRTGTGDSSRWEVFIERQPAMPGGQCDVVISNEGEVLEYWPGL